MLFINARGRQRCQPGRSLVSALAMASAIRTGGYPCWVLVEDDAAHEVMIT